MTRISTYFFLVFAFSFTTCKGGKGLSGNTAGNDSIAKPEYVKTNVLLYEDHIYKKNISTVQLHEKSWELSPALINLGGEQQLTLSFDDLNADLKNYSYTLTHCNADWQPSSLVFSEFADGFQENYINSYQYSFNTLQRYTHYSITFPNDNLKLTKTGNYIVKVYLDGDQDNVVLTKRFMVYDERVEVRAAMHQPMNEFRNYKQEIDFTILHSAYEIRNPYGDLKIVVMQNDRWDNAITGLKPVFIRDKELSYDFDSGENAFWGGNEYRHFDIKSLRYQTERIKDVVIDSLNRVALTIDEKRNKRYYSKTDINGKYLVKVQEGNRSETEADYAWVNFFIPWSTPLTDGDIYVFGEMSSWNYLPEYKMKYNYDRFGYEATVNLKQGYYNYEYMLLKDGDKTGDARFIEGSYYETENDYTVLVYNRALGTDYDQLIGVKRINSIKSF